MTQDELNQFTLECLVNQTQFRKYLEKTNPALYSERDEIASKAQKFRKEILAQVYTCLDQSSSSRIQHAFDAFLKECIRELERETDTFEEDMLIQAPSSINDDAGIEYWKKNRVHKV